MKILTLLALTTSLTGCAETVYRTQLEVYCPPLAQYTPEWNNGLADELDALPDDSTRIPLAITDYARLRDRIRLCEKEKEEL